MDYHTFSVDGPKGANQDRLVEPFLLNGVWTAAVADGVGGNPGGEIAAQIAVEVVRKSKGTERPADLFQLACADMLKHADKDARLSRMATTLTLLRIRERKATIAHVGDTRAYHVRGKGLITRTEDHTEVAHLLRENIISPRQARDYPRRNILTSYLSASGSFETFESEFDLIEGDKILLLTDGVYSAVNKRELVELADQMVTAIQYGQRIEGALRSRRIRDDSSAVVIVV
jgi:protein phosphatase